MKILQKDVKSAKAKGEATVLTVKNIQSDVDTHSTKLLTVDSDMKSLQKDVSQAKTKGAATELDVKKLTEETKGLELRMQKVLTENVYTVMPYLIHSGVRRVLSGQINLTLPSSISINYTHWSFIHIYGNICMLCIHECTLRTTQTHMNKWHSRIEYISIRN